MRQSSASSPKSPKRSLNIAGASHYVKGKNGGLVREAADLSSAEVALLPTLQPVRVVEHPANAEQRAQLEALEAQKLVQPQIEAQEEAWELEQRRLAIAEAQGRLSEITRDAKARADKSSSDSSSDSEALDEPLTLGGPWRDADLDDPSLLDCGASEEAVRAFDARSRFDPGRQPWKYK